MASYNCPECGHTIGAWTNWCPGCGRRLRVHPVIRLLIWLAVFGLVAWWAYHQGWLPDLPTP